MCDVTIDNSSGDSCLAGRHVTVDVGNYAEIARRNETSAVTCSAENNPARGRDVAVHPACMCAARQNRNTGTSATYQPPSKSVPESRDSSSQGFAEYDSPKP